MIGTEPRIVEVDSFRGNPCDDGVVAFFVRGNPVGDNYPVIFQIPAQVAGCGFFPGLEFYAESPKKP